MISKFLYWNKKKGSLKTARCIGKASHEAFSHNVVITQVLLENRQKHVSRHPKIVNK